MFAYVNIRHDKLPTSLFRVKRGKRYVVYCRNILGLTAAGVSARTAKLHYKEAVARVTAVCKRVGERMHHCTMDIYQRMEAGEDVAAHADNALYTIMSLTMAKQLPALCEGFKGLDSPLFKPNEKEELLTEMKTLVDMHTREDFANGSEHVVIRRTKK